MTSQAPQETASTLFSLEALDKQFKTNDLTIVKLDPKDLRSFMPPLHKPPCRN